MNDFIAAHAGLGIALACLQWTGWALPAWWVIRRLGGKGHQQGPGLGLALALGLSVGLVINFQLFFLAIVAARISAVWAVLASLPLYVLAWMGLVRLWRTGKQMEQPDAGGTTDGARRSPAPECIAAWLAVIGAVFVFGRYIAGAVPGVFWAWDAVVSWNRWALEWLDGVPPIFTVGYPQLLPTALASIDVWLGSPRTEPVARLMLLLFPIGVLLLLHDGWRRFRQASFLWGAAAWLVMLTFCFAGMADMGYADVPVAFYVSLTAYLLLLGMRGQVPVPFALVAGALAASAALLTKQPGGLALLIWLAAVAWRPAWRNARGMPSAWWRWAACAGAIFMALSAPWYLYVGWNILQGTEVTNLGYLTSTIHAGRSLAARLAHATTGPLAGALRGLGPLHVVVPVVVLLLLAACRSALGRVLVLGISVPYVLSWALLFSYDIRNIMPGMGVMALALGEGASVLWSTLAARLLPAPARAVRIDRDAQTRLGKALRRTAIATAVSLVLAAMLWPWPVHRIEALHTRLQMESQDAELNRMLLDYAHTPGFAGEVMTTYSPMVMIESLRPHVASLKRNPNFPPAANAAMQAGRPWCELQPLVPTAADVRYLLFHSVVLPNVIEPALKDGSLQLLVERNGVRLMKIQCAAP